MPRFDEHLTNEEKLAVEEIRGRVSALLGDRLQAMFLFGSKARGDYDSKSDVDLALVVEGLDRETKSGIFDIVADSELKYLVVISSLVLSSKDFADLRERERRIVLDIEREGIPL